MKRLDLLSKARYYDRVMVPQVGFLQGYSVQEGDVDSNVGVDSSKELKSKEMKAFVIKEDPAPKYKVFIEFFVPMFVAIFFFGYRNLTGAAQFSS